MKRTNEKNENVEEEMNNKEDRERRVEIEGRHARVARWCVQEVC